MDLASLAFSIDSSDTLKAVQALEALRQTTQATTQANQDFQTQGDFLVTSMANQGAAGARLSRQLGEIGDKFADLMTQAERARSAFDGSAATFDAWDIAQNKVEALGRAYGTTARGLDAYLQTANQLQMSSTQAAASVQRLTSALENQGAAAAAIRQTLTNNGVSITDLQTDQIDTLLTRIKAAFQNRPDTQQRTNDLRSVLGTFDPDVIGTFTNPNYVPIEQKRDMQIRSATDLGISRQDTATRERQRSYGRDQTQLSDLQEHAGGGGALEQSRSIFNGFGLFGGGWQGRGGPAPVSEEGIRALRDDADPDSAFARDGITTEAGRLAFYKQAMGTAIPPDLVGSPEKMTPAQRAAAGVQATPQFLPTGLTNWMDYIGSGKYSANAREIASLDDDEKSNGVGYFQRLWNSGTRSDRNFFGTYQSVAKPTPEPTALDQEGTGITLAGFGDNRIQRFQSALGVEKSLGVYQGNTGGDTLEAARNRGDAARGAFVGAYGKQDGEQNFRAAQARATDAAQRAYLDDGAVQDANVSLGLSTMSLGDSAEAKSFIAYARSRGVPASALAGQSFSDLMDPAKSAGGNLPAGALDTFKKQYAINSQAETNEFNRGNDHAMDNLREQAGVAGSGSANLQDLVTFQTAYDQALTKTNDTLKATAEANAAVTKAEAERSVQLQTTIGDLEDQNKATEKYIQTMSDPSLRVAGADRSAAGMTADIQTQVDALRRRNGPSFDVDKQAAYTSAQQAALGDQAVKSSQDKIALGEQDLRTQQRLLDVAGDRLGVQDKVNRDIQVELSFQKELAQAQASGDPGQVDKIQQAIAAMKRLKDAVAEVNLEAKAFKIGADADLAIKTSRERMALPPSQRGAYDFQGPVRDLQQQSQYPASGAGAGAGTVAAGDMNPTQRAFLQTIAGPESRGGDYNLRYTPDGGAHFDDLSQHPRVAEPIRGSKLTSTAAGAYQITGETWTGLQKQYGYTDFQPATQDHAAWNLASDTYKRMSNGGDLEADLQDPSKRANVAAALKSTWPTLGSGFGDTFDRNLHGQPGSTAMPNAAQNQTAIGGAAAKRDAEYGEQGRAAIQEINEQTARTTRGFNEQLPFVRKGDQVGETLTRAGQVNDADPRGLSVAQAEAQSKLIQQQQDYERQLTATKAATDITIDSNKQMAVAYGDSTKAVQDLQDKLKVEAEARTVQMSDQDKLARLTQLATQRMTEQTAATEQQAKAMREGSADQKAINDLGPFASEQQVGQRQAQLDIDRHIRDNPQESDQARQDYASARTDQEAVKEQTDSVNNYRQAWQSAESASFSALNSVITTGGKASDVVKSLASSLANIGLNTIEKSAGNWLTGQLGGLLGGSTGGSAFQAADALFAHATGGVFVNGRRSTRMFATGGMIDRPTQFYSAGGETNVAGEVGTEAILPLKRMPNGDLGVSTGSGGSGGSGVTVNAPITIQSNGNGGSGSSSPSQEQLTAMQTQLKEAVRQAVVAAIADEKRAGGSLY